MTRHEINNYIKFDELFEDLFQDNRDDLIAYKYESDVYHRLLNFHNHDKKEYALDVLECSLSDSSAVWVFVRSNNDSNENTAISTLSSYVIIYDFTLEEFTYCDYES